MKTLRDFLNALPMKDFEVAKALGMSHPALSLALTGARRFRIEHLEGLRDLLNGYLPSLVRAYPFTLEEISLMDKALRADESRTPTRSNTPEYKAWMNMLARCENPKSTSYHNYGGRGITVCERWRSFEAFLEDMGECGRGLTLERDDSDGPYSKANCRWATPKEQARNTSRNRLITHNGRTQCLAAWAEELGVKSSVLSHRLKRGMSVDKALQSV